MMYVSVCECLDYLGDTYKTDYRSRPHCIKVCLPLTILQISNYYAYLSSVRSTNVYEEQSLGIYDDDSEDENAFSTTGPRMTVWSRYLAMHARQQLAFGMSDVFVQ
jgi:hypothetical protein